MEHIPNEQMSLKEPIDQPWRETYLTRGNRILDVLDRSVIPYSLILGLKVRILLVGLGLHEVFRCSYNPYVVAAHLGGRDIDFEMTLVDIDEEVIENIRNKRHIVIPTHAYDHSVTDRFGYRHTWDKYLMDTKQLGRRRSLDGTEGVRIANVPSVFLKKLESGEISLVHSDIATANLGKTQTFDYVDCQNVLYQLQTDAQQLAFVNMTGALRVGGRMLVDDLARYGYPVFPRHGGWLDETQIWQLGLKIDDADHMPEGDIVLLRKFC